MRLLLSEGLRCVASFSSILRGDEIIGIDLGTTNSCVAVMEGKVSGTLRILGLDAIRPPPPVDFCFFSGFEKSAKRGCSNSLTV